jgi:hypothetical protein
VDRIELKRGQQKGIGLPGSGFSYRTTRRKLIPLTAAFLLRLICIVILIALFAMATAAIRLAH